MNKEISIKTINNIKECLYRIFDAEDEDYPNRRVVAANNRAIDHYLKDYSKEQQYELLNLIRWHNDNCVKELEKAGWKIIREK